MIHENSNFTLPSSEGHEQLQRDQTAIQTLNALETDLMKVNRKHRMLIDGRILDMSAFNAEGNCYLDTQNAIDESTKVLIQPYLFDHHGQIAQYFETIQKLQYSSSDVLSTVMCNDQLCHFCIKNRGGMW